MRGIPRLKLESIEHEKKEAGRTKAEKIAKQ
jgi:hypothetical protein